jgi:hypothetical protein
VIRVSVFYLAPSIAILGGALGAALQSHASVREAAYTYQPDSQLSTADPPEPAPAP